MAATRSRPNSHFRRICAIALVAAGLCSGEPVLADGCPQQAVVEAVLPNGRSGTLTIWGDDGGIQDAKGSPPVIAAGFVARVVECRRSATQHLIYRVQVSSTQFVWLSPSNLRLKVVPREGKCGATTQPFGQMNAAPGISCEKGGR